MDGPRQQYVQLTHYPSPSRGSSAAATPTMTQPSDEAARSLISMCRSLYLVVYEGRTEAVMELLLQQRHGSDVTDSQATGIINMHGQCNILEVTAEKNTVLHVAAEHGHDELIRELARFRDQGLLALLCHKNSALDTPLHCAARAGHVNAITVLLELARDCGEMSILGYKNEAGDTALHLAARHGHGNTVRVLMLAAAEPAAELNNAGVSPLYLAVMSGSVEAVRAITTRRDASSAGPSSQNALHAAVFQSLEMVELLLEWWPPLAEQVDSSGSSPLHFASAEGNWAIVNAILGAAPPRTVYLKDSPGGLSALHVAARMGHDSVVVDMIRMCPDAAELRDNGGGTFVHAAAREKRTWVVSAAIKSPLVRSLLNAQDREGNTPLHLAVDSGAPDVVEALLRKGKVRAHVLNNGGHTAFDLAAKSEKFFTMVCMVVTLIAYGAQLRPQRLDDLKLPSGHGIAKGIEKTSDSLAVVAVLLATSAYTAGFNVPGGYNSDISSDKGGKAVLDLVGNGSFTIFLFLDTVAVVTSVVAVILLVYGKASLSAGSWKSFVVALHCMWASFISLLLAFYAALAAVASTKLVYLYGLLTINATIFGLSIFIGKWIGPATTLRTVWRFLWRCLPSYFKGRHVIRRQYPLAGAAVLNLIPFVVASLLSFVGIGFIVASQGQAAPSPAPAPSPL